MTPAGAATNDAQRGTELYGVLIGLQGETWLLPNAAVADVQPFEQIDVHAGHPDWLVGFKLWRGRRLPVVSGEALSGQPLGDRTERSRLVVLHTVGDHSDAGQCLLITQGYPQLVSVNETAVQPEPAPELSDAEQAALNKRPVITRVRIGAIRALIPDLDALDRMLHQAVRSADVDVNSPAI